MKLKQKIAYRDKQKENNQRPKKRHKFAFNKFELFNIYLRYLEDI